jgi:hypothetical protein
MAPKVSEHRPHRRASRRPGRWLVALVVTAIAKIVLALLEDLLHLPPRGLP